MEKRTVLDWALMYAAHGIAVLPIKKGTKNPGSIVGKGWGQKASKAESQLREWFENHPERGICCVTGEISDGLVAIDVDSNPGEEINLLEFVEHIESCDPDQDELSKTWVVRSGRGGLHLYFKSKNPDVETLKGLAVNCPGVKAVDFQAHGAAVVLPPTIHSDTGKSYEWIYSPEGVELAPYEGPAQNFITGLFLEKYGVREKFEPAKADEIIEEGGRTTYLTKECGRLANKDLTAEEIEAVLRHANETQCVPPLTDEEFEKTILPMCSKWEKPETKVSKNAVVTCLADIEEQEAEWLIPGYIPKKQITVLAAEGGAGKTTIWCNIAAAISSGGSCILDYETALPERKPGKVLFFSAEDSVPVVLKKRLKRNGANMENLITIDLTDEAFSAVSFNGEFLEKLLEKHRPKLCIFDPIQSFIPGNIKMADRNAMRQCLEPLVKYGALYGTSFIIVVHANKLAGAYGRKRIADSSDIWDLARSVLMAGSTGEDNERYISQEKSNYGVIQDTVIFSIDNGLAQFEKTSTKHDKDFVLNSQYNERTKPQRENAKELILGFLDDEKAHEVSDLDEFVLAAGVSESTLKRAKTDLKKDNLISYSRSGKDKPYFIQKCKTT